MTKNTYEQPREKLARKGAQSLSNAELLQVIIGSGNAKTPVTKIAKNVARVLEKSGPRVHPQELLAIPGVGIVRSGQIVALFELAARFPIAVKSDVFEDINSLKPLYQELTNVSSQSALYCTFDGAHRLILKRQVQLNKSNSVSKQVQKIFADCITDSANSIMVAIGSIDQQLQPELYELNFMRNVYKTAQLIGVSVRLIVLVSKDGENRLKDAV